MFGKIGKLITKSNLIIFWLSVQAFWEKLTAQMSPSNSTKGSKIFIRLRPASNKFLTSNSIKLKGASFIKTSQSTSVPWIIISCLVNMPNLPASKTCKLNIKWLKDAFNSNQGTKRRKRRILYSKCRRNWNECRNKFLRKFKQNKTN